MTDFVDAAFPLAVEEVQSIEREVRRRRGERAEGERAGGGPAGRRGRAGIEGVGSSGRFAELKLELVLALALELGLARIGRGAGGLTESAGAGPRVKELGRGDECVLRVGGGARKGVEGRWGGSAAAAAARVRTMGASGGGEGGA